MDSEKSIRKICSFYVSDLHLITMLLPYMDKQIKSQEKFVTISQKDLIEEVKMVLSRLTLNNNDRNELISIDWHTNTLCQYKILEKELKKVCKNHDKISIIVNGTREYIELACNNLNKFFSNNQIHSKIRIISCYDITKLDEDIKDILRTHDAILNTSGEKEISEVFEGYEKRVGA